MATYITEINYLAENDAIVLGHDMDDSDYYHIFVPTFQGGVTVIIDLDTDWAINHQDWPHTDAEAENVDKLARNALEEYFDHLLERR